MSSGYTLFSVPVCKTRMPYRSAVSYDPPSAPIALGSIGKQIDTQYHMGFKTEIARQEARVLLDIEASQCLESKDFRESVNMQSVAALSHSSSRQQEEQKSQHNHYAKSAFSYKAWVSQCHHWWCDCQRISQSSWESID